MHDCLCRYYQDKLLQGREPRCQEAITKRQRITAFAAWHSTLSISRDPTTKQRATGLQFGRNRYWSDGQKTHTARRSSKPPLSICQHCLVRTTRRLKGVTATLDRLGVDHNCTLRRSLRDFSPLWTGHCPTAVENRSEFRQVRHLLKTDQYLVYLAGYACGKTASRPLRSAVAILLTRCRVILSVRIE